MDFLDLPLGHDNINEVQVDNLAQAVVLEQKIEFKFLDFRIGLLESIQVLSVEALLVQDQSRELFRYIVILSLQLLPLLDLPIVVGFVMEHLLDVVEVNALPVLHPIFELPLVL